jgi:hypothetical protein
MFNPHAGMCDKCRQEKMVAAKWINGSTKSLCASCMKEVEISETLSYERYLTEITDPRD